MERDELVVVLLDEQSQEVARLVDTFPREAVVLTHDGASYGLVAQRSPRERVFQQVTRTAASTEGGVPL